MLRRTLTLLAAAASLAGAAPATASGGEAAAAPPGAYHLVVTVRHSGPATDGTFSLDCHPARGRHPSPAAACAAVTRASRGTRDPFAPVPGDAICTMVYGGPARARVTGRWHGRPLDASFNRSNGCELSRWDALVPLLPDIS